jgi:carbonic anhydrase
VRLGDTNTSAIIQFAVGPLEIKNIAVVGHTDCAGIRVALKATPLGSTLPPPPLGKWIEPLVDLARTLNLPADEKEAFNILVRASIRQQVRSCPEGMAYRN